MLTVVSFVWDAGKETQFNLQGLFEMHGSLFLKFCKRVAEVMRFPGDFLTLRISKTATFTDHFLLTRMASLWNIWITMSTVVTFELHQCLVLCHIKGRCYSLVGNLMEFKIKVYYFRHQGSKVTWWLKSKNALKEPFPQILASSI